jgi:hypothetical protein
LCGVFLSMSKTPAIITSRVNASKRVQNAARGFTAIVSPVRRR